MADSADRPAQFPCEPMVIPIRRVRGEMDSDLPLPQYMSPNAAGMDLHAAVDSDLSLAPQEIALVSTGIAVGIPPGFEGQVRARSGLACTHGLAVINAPGTIDSDYRGEIKVGLINLGKSAFTIHRGDRIAQLIISRVYRIEWNLRRELDDTARNDGGFGHTGR